MSSPSELSARIGNLRSQNETQRVRNGELSEQIARLEAASNSVSDIYDDDKSFVSWIDTYDTGLSWQGDRREEFEERKSSAKTSGDTYCEKVSEVYDAILKKKSELEAELSSGQRIINANESTLGWLQFQLNISNV